MSRVPFDNRGRCQKVAKGDRNRSRIPNSQKLVERDSLVQWHEPASCQNQTLSPGLLVESKVLRQFAYYSGRKEPKKDRILFEEHRDQSLAVCSYSGANSPIDSQVYDEDLVLVDGFFVAYLDVLVRAINLN